MPLAGSRGRDRAPSPGEPGEGDRLDLRRRGGRAARARPEAAALRQVLVPRLRGRRADERAEGAVDGHRLAPARGPAAERREGRPRGRPFASGAEGARRAAARLLAEGPPRARGVALGARARGTRDRHEGPGSRRRLHRRGVQGDGSGAGRGRRHVLPVVPLAEVTLGRRGHPAQRDRRAARGEGRVEGPVGPPHRALRSPRPRLARRPQGRRGEAPPRRRRQRERRRGDAGAGEGAGLAGEAAADDRVRRVRGGGVRPPRLEALRRAPASSRSTRRSASSTSTPWGASSTRRCR